MYCLNKKCAIRCCNQKLSKHNGDFERLFIRYKAEAMSHKGSLSITSV